MTTTTGQLTVPLNTPSAFFDPADETLKGESGFVGLIQSQTINNSGYDERPLVSSYSSVTDGAATLDQAGFSGALLGATLGGGSMRRVGDISGPVAIPDAAENIRASLSATVWQSGDTSDPVHGYGAGLWIFSEGANFWAESPAGTPLLNLNYNFGGASTPTTLTPPSQHVLNFEDIANLRAGRVAAFIGPVGTAAASAPDWTDYISDFSLVVTWTVPTTPGLPPLRQYPRTDGLGASSTQRVWPPSRSLQASNRQVGGYS